MSKKLTLLVALLGMTACAAAPVQEMSDARQAIRSAEEVGAARYSAEHLNYARYLLEQAQMSLQAGAYFDARRYALDAKQEAILAREKALTQSPSP